MRIYFVFAVYCALWVSFTLCMLGIFYTLYLISAYFFFFFLNFFKNNFRNTSVNRFGSISGPTLCWSSELSFANIWSLIWVPFPWQKVSFFPNYSKKFPIPNLRTNYVFSFVKFVPKLKIACLTIMISKKHSR